jgi:hypothetical protein
MKSVYGREELLADNDDHGHCRRLFLRGDEA